MASHNHPHEHNVLVEDEEALENLELVLVRDSPAHLVVKLFVRKRLFDFETLIGQCRPVRGDKHKS